MLSQANSCGIRNCILASQNRANRLQLLLIIKASYRKDVLSLNPTAGLFYLNSEH